MQKLRADMGSATEAGRIAIGALFQGRNAFYLLQLRDSIDLNQLLPDLSPAQRGLDVAILHRIVFSLCLGMNEQSVQDEQFLAYVREFGEGAGRVFEGRAQACFFLNPAGIDQVREIALAGRLLPQKSTDFYPKLLSGLAIYRLES